MALSQNLMAVDLRWAWAIVLLVVAVVLTLLVRRLHGGRIPRS
jgi:hypothetical protein